MHHKMHDSVCSDTAPPQNSTEIPAPMTLRLIISDVEVVDVKINRVGRPEERAFTHI